LTQPELARLLGLSPFTISRWENGEGIRTPELLGRALSDVVWEKLGRRAPGMIERWGVSLR
jgi:transcriptional regulator with XRE-family HTH domain